MKKRGAQPGNKNAAKNKPWQDAINRAIARYGDGSYDGGLNQLADKLIVKCLDADMPALKELGDRLDGKAAQSVSLAGEDDGPLVIHLKTDYGNNSASE